MKLNIKVISSLLIIPVLSLSFMGTLLLNSGTVRAQEAEYVGGYRNQDECVKDGGEWKVSVARPGCYKTQGGSSGGGGGNSNDADSSDTGGSSEDKEREEEPSCATKGGATAWIMCPLIDLIEEGLERLDTQIQRLLEVNQDYYATDTIRSAFNSIRNIAYIILVPIMLVMVIGTALGFDFVSAYTVKRALPRFILATIFIALSLDICIFLVDFTNSLGRATLGIMTAPFSDGVNGIRLSELFNQGLLGSVLTGVTGIPALILIMLWSAGTLLLGVLAAFAVLLLRQMFIVVLMLAAPLAILAWIFPGNDRLWKLWWGTFSKLLLMFPLIMAIIAMGRIFAFTIHQADGAGLDGAIVQPLMTLFAYLLPYAFIPFTFKFAGGMFATVSGMVNDRSRGLSDRYKKLRSKGVEHLGENAQQGKLFGAGAKEGSRRSRWNERAERLANQKAGGLTLNRQRRRRRIEGHLNAHDLQRSLKHTEEDSIARQVMANDDAMEAGRFGGGDYNKTRGYLVTKGYEFEEAASLTEQILSTRKEMGGRGFELASLVKLPGTGTGMRGEEGIAEWGAAVDKAAGNDAGIRGALVAAGKSGFAGSSRHEVGQASFGTLIGATRRIGRATTDEQRQAEVRKIALSAYQSGGPAAVVAARGDVEAKIFSDVINDELADAEASYGEAEAIYQAAPSKANKRIVDLRRTEVVRQKAAISAINDSMGQAKQAVSKVFGDRVMGAKIRRPKVVFEPEFEEVSVPTGVLNSKEEPIMKIERRETGEVVRRVVEGEFEEINRVQEFQELATDREWQQYKREYVQAIDSEMAQRASQAARIGSMQPGGTKPGGIGPGQLGPNL